MRRACRWALAAWVGTCAAAHADEKITLRLGDSLPVGHIIHTAVTKPFMEAVERRTNGLVEMRHFPAEQLGKAKDYLMLTQSGVVDIGYVVPSYASDKMPLTAAAELPGSFSNYCHGTAAYYELTREGAFLGDKEFKPNGVRALITFALPTYQFLLSTRKLVASLKDLEGLKIRTAGGALDLMVRGLKAVPIRMSPPEIYESMSRGTLDGALLGYQSAVSYDLLGLLKSGTINEPLSSVVITYSISEARWKTLPDPVRTILAEEEDRTTRESCAKFGAAENDAIARAKGNGITFVHFSGEDDTVLASVFETVKQDWAAGLNRRGKPGTAALEAWGAALKKAGETQ